MQSDQAVTVSRKPADRVRVQRNRRPAMAKFFLWLILLVLCWPLALLALLLYPVVWLLLLPFKLLGIAVGGILAFFRALIFLPARVLGGPRPA